MKLTSPPPPSLVPPPDIVCDLLRPALQRVWIAIETGIQRTVEFFAQLDRSADASLAPNLVRFLAKQSLDENDLPASIVEEFEREELGNNGLLVRFGDHQLRILKSDAGRPPVPGRSEAKQDFYQQSLLDVGIADLEAPIKPLRVLVLWDALPGTYAFEGMSVVLPEAGGETRPSVRWHWQRQLTEAFIGASLEPLEAGAAEPDEDLPITKKQAASTGTGGGNDDQ